MRLKYEPASEPLHISVKGVYRLDAHGRGLDGERRVARERATRLAARLLRGLLREAGPPNYHDKELSLCTDLTHTGG